MQINVLKNIVIKSLDDMKAEDIVCLDVTDLSNVTDYMVIATGTSNRQVKSLASALVMNVKAAGVEPLGIEGNDVGEWVLLDLGDVIVHIMQQKTRDFYQLEQLWNTPEPGEGNNRDALSKHLGARG